MKNSIWKYNLEVTDQQTIEMPIGSIPLSIQLQDDSPVLWAMVNTEAKKAPRSFVTFGTGHPVYMLDLEYIGTYQIPDRNLVFHVFEKLGN